MSLIAINQALQHPKKGFPGSKQTEFPFIPPPKGAENGVFHLVSPAGPFEYSSPPLLVVLSSVIRLMFINQALGLPKIRFSGSRRTEFLLIPTPLHGSLGKPGIFQASLLPTIETLLAAPWHLPHIILSHFSLLRWPLRRPSGSMDHSLYQHHYRSYVPPSVCHTCSVHPMQVAWL